MNSDLKQEFKIVKWIENVAAEGCNVKKINGLCEVRKQNEDLLFALLDTEVISPEGQKLPHIVFIRGHACVIVTLLKNISTGEENFLMVRQRRIGNGHFSLEFPAGMLDEEIDPFGVAVRELHEETGLSIEKDELFSLTDRKLYSSPGASDEAIYYFGCIKELDNDIYESFRVRKGGNSEEGEHINVTLMKREDAESEATSLQVRLGFFLFEQFLKNNGR